MNDYIEDGPGPSGMYFCKLDVSNMFWSCYLPLAERGVHTHWSI